MRNKTIKIVVLVITAMLLITMNSMVFAVGAKDVDDSRSPAYNPTTTSEKKSSGTSPIDNPEAYKPSQTGENSKVVTNMLSIILGVIKTIGTLVSVGILMILGIKYMVGSVEQKANYKKTMIPYLIGALFLFATPRLVSAIYVTIQNM